MKPGEALSQDLMFQDIHGKPLRAVFLNYLLDCLPAAVLELPTEPDAGKGDRHHLPEAGKGDRHRSGDAAGETSRQMEPVPFSGARGHYLEPYSESGSIHSRLVGHKLSYRTALRFQERFSQAAAEALQEPIAKARECLKVGRFELASSFYQQALARQPGNWALLSEVAQFLIFSLRDVKAGIDLAKVALALNPTCSSELWNTLGDGLFEYGRYAEARSAYLKALEVNDADVRARYNLAWVYQREKNYAAALQMIAAGLALDKMGQYRERLLAKQQEVVAQQVRRHQTEYLLLVNLVSKYPAPGQAERPKEEEARPPA
jgi:tetratricopeptide (TPR) repeat protein